MGNYEVVFPMILAAFLKQITLNVFTLAANGSWRSSFCLIWMGWDFLMDWEIMTMERLDLEIKMR